jgi:succinate-semialdehyde dehydrogenase/glutarate-semialdehyde dehydrogenase
MQGYIDGKWATSSTGSTFPVHDPATMQEIARVADMDAKDARKAVQAAKEAWGPWRRKAPKVRREAFCIRDH